MARERPLDLALVQTWLASRDEGELFSDAAIHHLQSLIADSHCLVVVTLGVGHEPRSLMFRRVRQVLPPERDNRPLHSTSRAAASCPLSQALEKARTSRHVKIVLAPSMFVSPVAPVAPPIGQLWHQTGVKSERAPKLERILILKLERVLRWDGADWEIAGYVSDSPWIMKQGKQACDFQEALASAHRLTNVWDCEFIYTYDGSTWGNA
jgi:hypothetical protein